jgi:hypothetical protein
MAPSFVTGLAHRVMQGPLPTPPGFQTASRGSPTEYATIEETIARRL